MTFIADLHIHSKYSRATAKNLDFENLYKAAQLKGIRVVGTGDFTYPDWIDQIREKLVEAEPGLFKLREDIAGQIDPDIPPSCRRPVRFILQTEISSIYKKDDRVRKNHNLVYFPDIESVERFNARLDSIGNIKSDGRPILGLDAANLLEIMLEINENGFFIPAHIWTPWFSLFGSKSGFDTIEECFGSLSHHIFAVETGLSSDPPMNWRIPQLDDRRLISSSDAHSPMYLGRNATVFNREPDYFQIRDALSGKDPQGYGGTLDMYPEEGKYHFDGHRKCNICLNPKDTLAYGGICPECNKPLTLGVLYRVQELARRPEGYRPEARREFSYIIPLAEILSEIFQVGPKTKKVNLHYHKALETLGPELEILLNSPLSDLETIGIPLLAQAVEKMRSGNVNIDPGFDGEFGKVKLFSDSERKRANAHTPKLFTSEPAAKPKPGSAHKKKETAPPSSMTDPVSTKENPELPPTPLTEDKGLIEGLNNEQKRAVLSDAARIIIQAGPGTGKTRTLTARAAYLVSENKTRPERILVMTFTHKAAREVEHRIKNQLPDIDSQVVTGTFHGFCLSLLQEFSDHPISIAEETARKALIRQAAALVENRTGSVIPKPWVKAIDTAISLCKQSLLTPEDAPETQMPDDFKKNISSDRGSEGPGLDHPGKDTFLSVWTCYEEICKQLGLLDFDALIEKTIHMFKTRPDIAQTIQNRFDHILIDEYQDINKGQYALTRMISETSNLLVIGDPDQSIYGFRGSDKKYFDLFTREHPDAEHYSLKQNYRSTQTILDASFQMITQKNKASGKEAIFSDLKSGRNLIIQETASEKAEAVAVGKAIERYIGGTSFFSMDANRVDAGGGPETDIEFSFSDFAVLYRTKKQCQAFIKAFENHGIPFQTADKENILALKGISEWIGLLRLAANRAGFLEIERLLDFFKAGLGTKGKLAFRQWFLSQDMTSAPDLLTRLEHLDIKGLRPSVQVRISAVAAELKTMITNVGKETLKDTLIELARESGIERLILEHQNSKDTFNRLLVLGDTPGMTLEGLLDRLALDQDPDQMDEGSEKVTLMTMHASKGLEFPVVFITGCEQGFIPYTRNAQEPENIDEERRLFYVAMTRAKQILCLTYAKKRPIFGIEKKQSKSVFLKDIEEKLKQYAKTAPLKKANQPAARQMELFG